MAEVSSYSQICVILKYLQHPLKLPFKMNCVKLINCMEFIPQVFYVVLYETYDRFHPTLDDVCRMKMNKSYNIFVYRKLISSISLTATSCRGSTEEETYVS